MPSTPTTTSKNRTAISRSLFSGELSRLEEALSRDVILTVGHPAGIIMSVVTVAVAVGIARWWGPAHDAIGLEDALLPLVMAVAALATGLASWGLARSDRMSLARACQFPDFVVWGLLPIAIGWGCTEALGVVIAVAVHALMALRWALFIRGSWILRAIVLATWGPLFLLSAHHGWIAALCIPTSVLFIVANYTSNAHRAETERLARERTAQLERLQLETEHRAQEQADQLERLQRDFAALSRSFSRVVKEVWPEDEV
jgi:hypothetical protein